MTQSYPLQWPEGWPRATDRRVSAPFRTTFSAALKNLHAELRRLKATDIVVSSWLPLRNDGQPRADAARMRIDDPGVAVYFALRNRPMVMARDVFWNVHDNLHSIGHAIAHLRGLERHGGGVMLERAFAGFAALPAPEHKEHWSKVLGYPENWQALSPETQRTWINNRFRELYSVHVNEPLEAGRLRDARADALANVGQAL